MDKRIAVIDLGTNTCNLVIAELNGTDCKILYQGKEPVRLSGTKDEKNWISENAFLRASQAVANYIKKAGDYSVNQKFLVATSAVREAINRDEFVAFIQDKTGLLADVVSGDREAELIFNGVLLAFGTIGQPSLILDIGGGSNEFVITDGRDIIWKDSIPAGMARILHLFKMSDPIRQEELRELRQFFRMQNAEAVSQCKSAGIKSLIGCSGAFDTIADMIDKVNPGIKKRITQKIEWYSFLKVYEKLIASTRAERKIMKGMDNVRIDLIVPAVILIKQILTDTGIEEIYQTGYALREGVLYEML
jgi:exopolyphosphatase / guanosine-5'-triphosphate,3'-diphosphate pyrophosphatase